MTTPLLDNEKRHFQRIHFVSNIDITINGQKRECVLLDISLKGLLIERPQEITINPGDLYPLKLTLGKDTFINMQANVTHIESNHLGLQWVNIDLDSLTTLRRLLELNLSDCRRKVVMSGLS